MSGKAPAGGIAAALRGVSLLARGNTAGLGYFTGTPQGFLSSLTPFLAFALVGAVLQTFQGNPGDAVIEMLVTVVALLAPAVASHVVARAWRREEQWLLYAVAFNWCHWAIPVVAAALFILLMVLAGIGVPVRPAAAALLLVFLGYALWLHWFVARHALGLAMGQAVGLVLLVNLATAATVMGPGFLAWLMR